MKPLDERVQRLLDGELSADEERELRRALEQDPTAARDLAVLESGLAVLADRPAPRLPADFQARVLARVAARPAPSDQPGLFAAFRDLWEGLSWPRAAAMGSALALVACLAGLVGYRAGTRAAPPVQASAPSARETVLVRFTLTAPEAQKVELAGSFNRWGEKAITLARGENGTWNATVELPRGRYEYAFVVDGKRFVADQDAADFADDGFGDRNAVLDI